MLYRSRRRRIFASGLYNEDGTLVDDGTVTLAALSLTPASIAESASIGTTVGATGNTTSGSTLSLTDDAGGLFALSGGNIVTAGALDYETATSHSITIRETLSGATNTPRDTVLSITVTDVTEGGTLTSVGIGADGATSPIYGNSTYPAALYVPATDTTWLSYEGFLASERWHRLKTFNHTTETWSDTVACGRSLLADDSHGVPALFRDADGRVHWFGGAHNSQLLHNYTTYPDDPSDWTAGANLTGNCAYPRPVFDGTNLYLFVRGVISSAPIQFPLRLRKSTSIVNGVISFAAEVTLVDFGSDSRVYLGFAHDDGTHIHLVATFAPGDDSYRRHVYYFRYVKATGALTNAAGTRTDTTLPVDLSTANTHYRIVDQGSLETATPSGCATSDGTIHIAYLEGSGTSFAVKHLTISGGTVSTPTTATTLTNGSRLDTATLVVRSDDAVELYYPDNSAGTFTRGGSSIARRVYNGSWGSASTVQTIEGSKALDSASRVENGHDGLRVIFCERATNDNDSSAGSLRIYAAGDDLPTPDAYTPDPGVGLQLSFDGADGATRATDESLYQLFQPVSFVGNAQIDTAQSKFGGASLLLDGNGDYCQLTGRSRFGAATTESRTWEAWFRVSAFDTGQNQTIIDTRPTASQGGFTFVISNTSKLLVLQAFTSAATVVSLSSTTVIAVGTWYHGRVVKSGTSWYLFVNGTLEASGTQTAQAGNEGDLYIGRSGFNTSPRYFKGHIDEVRITSRAESTSSFTPPAAAYAHP